jgi:hypothetical protein
VRGLARRCWMPMTARVVVGLHAGNLRSRRIRCNPVTDAPTSMQGVRTSAARPMDDSGQRNRPKERAISQEWAKRKGHFLGIGQKKGPFPGAPRCPGPVAIAISPRRSRGQDACI